MLQSLHELKYDERVYLIIFVFFVKFTIVTIWLQNTEKSVTKDGFVLSLDAICPTSWSAFSVLQNEDCSLYGGLRL